MSFAAAAGPPHNRLTAVNGDGPVGTMDESKAGATGVSKGPRRIFPHLEDLTSVRPEVDINWPIRKILQDAELLAKQANTHLDFRRPDIALQEFIKSYILATETIPRHKEYPSLSSSQSELHRSYMGLLKRIKAQQGRFEESKKVIQEDNERTGVLPLSSGAAEDNSTRATNGSSKAIYSTQDSGYSNGTAGPSRPNGSANGSTTPKKPPVQPKPSALHGKALQSSVTTNSTTSVNSDLANRFARLRSPASALPQQDPRIRTRPITIPSQPEATIKSPTTSKPAAFPTVIRPLGPREMPSVPTTALRADLPLNTQLPIMPKPPDAIYSPSRNPDTAATINFPTSNPRISPSVGSGNNAAPPVSKVGRTPSVDGRQEYFSPARKSSDSGPPREDPILPNSTTVSANDLTKYLRMGSQVLRILLVDVRTREEFDEGHIMSPSIICIEPLTLRPGISSEELLESLVLSPESELKLYEVRHEFDLVVFYDQRSFSLRGSDSQASDSSLYLQDFAKAVYDYGYDKQLKRRPMLLLGGLDAWTDLMGPSSLQSSLASTAPSKTSSVNGTKSGRPLGRTPISRDAYRNPAARRRTYQSRPLSKEEESKWDETMKERPTTTSPTTTENDSTDDFSYVRTTEDFFRRYPELPLIQESMISSRPAFRSHKDGLINPMSKPPARPAPALPRQRSSGIVERTLIASYAMQDENSRPEPLSLSNEAPDGGGLTGLNNPGQHCYALSVIQCISASGQFRDYLLNFQVGPQTAVPRKDGESTDPPQILVKLLGSLLRHMWSGQYDFVKPTTFMAYINALHKAATSDSKTPKRLLFGGPSRQHDASEFMGFLIDNLHDESNKKRNMQDYQAQNAAAASQPGFDDLRLSNLEVGAAVRQEWRKNLAGSDSEVSRFFQGMEATITECGNCGFEKKNFAEFTALKVDFPQKYTERGVHIEKVSLTEMLDESFNKPGNDMEDVLCASCEKRANAQQKRAITYMPDYLILDFPRFRDDGDKEYGKIRTRIDFTESLNLDKIFISVPSPPARPDDTPADRGHVGPFQYDVYAVIMHIGKQIQSGHYFALARSIDKPGHPSSRWHEFNDKIATPAEFAECQTKRKNTYATVTNIFLKRRQRA